MRQAKPSLRRFRGVTLNDEEEATRLWDFAAIG